MSSEVKPIQMVYDVFKLIIKHGKDNAFQSEYVILGTCGFVGANEEAAKFCESHYDNALWTVENCGPVEDDRLLDSPILVTFAKKTENHW